MSFFAPLFYSTQTSLEPPSKWLLSTTFHFPFYHFPLPVSHISSLLPLPPPFLLLPRAVCRGCHNRRWNRFICSNVVWAAAWHGTEQHFLPAHRELLSLSVCSSCVFKQANQHHSAVLALLSLSPSASHNLCSQCVCRKPPTLSHTHTIIYGEKLQWQTVPFSFFFPTLSSNLWNHISVFLSCSVICFTLLILSSTHISTLFVSLSAKTTPGHITSLYKTQTSTVS